MKMNRHIRASCRAALVVGFAEIILLSPAAADPAAQAAPYAPSEKALRADLTRAEARSATLFEKARQDWRIPLIEQYRSWTEPAEFVNPKNRRVTAKLLVDWMSDESPSTLPAVRELARDALLDATAKSLNPDLSSSSKGKRSAFCLEKLVPLLSLKTSDVTRRFAAAVLDGMAYSSSPDIRRYNSQDPSTWKPAQDAYRKLLGR